MSVKHNYKRFESALLSEEYYLVPVEHIDNAKVVYSNTHGDTLFGHKLFSTYESDTQTHKALLINITEIKKETREERLERVLQDIITAFELAEDSMKGTLLLKDEPVIERAKDALEREGEG